MQVNVSNQAELDAALQRGDYPECYAGVFVIYGSSQVTAYDSSQVTAYGSSQVRASKFVAVTIHGKNVRAKGGVQIKIPEIATAKAWCEHHGVEVKKGVAVLFKAVEADYSTGNARAKGIFYKPGDTPSAPDWDGGIEECGGGLHFSPTPGHALEFNREAKHFVACPVKIKSIKVHKNATYPQKIKAPSACGPCCEVDIHGNKIG